MVYDTVPLSMLVLETHDGLAADTDCGAACAGAATTHSITAASRASSARRRLDDTRTA